MSAPRKTDPAPASGLKHEQVRRSNGTDGGGAASEPRDESLSGPGSDPNGLAGRAGSGPPSLLTRPLGLEGWVHLEPVLLASLASAEPLLLVGRHGTAKSFLLERLARALGLSFRCYNASLIDFDDLVGIPVPDPDGKGLHYISTPTAIWGAEVVFVDELNRTRPDLANKLFPILHERRVQGVDLHQLRHRWAAMNPPLGEDSSDDEPGYLGVEPLDPALADRFGFLIDVPDWSQLTVDEQERVLHDQFSGPHPLPIDLAQLVASARARLTRLRRRRPGHMARYFLALGTLLLARSPLDRVRKALQLGEAIPPLELGPMVIDALGEQNDHAMRTATALAL